MFLSCVCKMERLEFSFGTRTGSKNDNFKLKKKTRDNKVWQTIGYNDRLAQNFEQTCWTHDEDLFALFNRKNVEFFIKFTIRWIAVLVYKYLHSLTKSWIVDNWIVVLGFVHGHSYRSWWLTAVASVFTCPLTFRLSFPAAAPAQRWSCHCSVLNEKQFPTIWLGGYDGLIVSIPLNQPLLRELARLIPSCWPHHLHSRSTIVEIDYQITGLHIPDLGLNEAPYHREQEHWLVNNFCPPPLHERVCALCFVYKILGGENNSIGFVSWFLGGCSNQMA